MLKKFLKFCFLFCLVVFIIAAIIGAAFGAYYYQRLTRDLPKIERLSDYSPKGVTSIYSEEGVLIAELYEERRYPASFEEIPVVVKNAFLAAEDANFYKHPGIDFKGIVRAAIVNIKAKGSKKQGASTITQQVVKSLLLTREKTYERKLKEALLSYRLESALTKDEILSIYLNEIFLGQTSYGVKAASRVHFQKEMEDLTVAEAAYLAGMPQKPSYFASPKNREEAIERQRYVLGQMLANEMISKEDFKEAHRQDLKIYLPKSRTYHKMHYFASHVSHVLREKLLDIDPNLSPEVPGGYEVTTTGSMETYELARRSLRKGLMEVDQRRGWRGPIETISDKEKREEFQAKQRRVYGRSLKAGELYKALVTGVDKKNKLVSVELGNFKGTVSLKKAAWAKQYLYKVKTKEKVKTLNPINLLKTGSLIEVMLDDQALKESVKKGEEPYTEADSNTPFVLTQTPELQAAFSVANALSGEVKAIIGGFDFNKSVFNRATQGKLQPGSSFKPFIYLAAVEQLGYTAATIVPDSPVAMRDGTGKTWRPQNYDRRFLGPITLRTALQRSRNVVSVHLLKRVGVDTGIEYARNLGITTNISRNMSIALGTPEVHQIEMVRAYSAFPGGGYLPDSIVIKQVKDRNGNIIYEQHPENKKVISEESAFVMANMMKGVVERGTAQILKKLKRPVAGKTGTTNDQMDAWFIGYTPEWAAGAWVGFDVKKTIGRWETGGKAAAPIFLYFMEEFLKDQPKLDFEIPNGVIPVKIDANTGRLVSQNNPHAFTEYFKIGTEPTHSSQDIELPRDYLSSDEF